MQWYLCGHPDSLIPKCTSIVLEIRLRRAFALPPFITQHLLFSYTIKKPCQKPPNAPPPIGEALHLVILIDQPKLAFVYTCLVVSNCHSCCCGCHTLVTIAFLVVKHLSLLTHHGAFWKEITCKSVREALDEANGGGGPGSQVSPPPAP